MIKVKTIGTPIFISINKDKRMQIPGQKWFPLLKRFPPPSRAKRGEVKKTRRALARRVARAMTREARHVNSFN